MSSRKHIVSGDSLPPPIIFAGVDATREVKTAAAYAVQGYPMLKLFKRNVTQAAAASASTTGETIVLDYRGARTTAAIVKWLQRKTGPTCPAVTTKDQLDTLVAAAGVVIVGFFDENENSDDARLFEAVAADDEANRYVFGHGASLRAAYRTKIGDILLLKSFDSGEARLLTSPPLSKTALARFVGLEGRPLLYEFSARTAQAIFGAGIHRHLLYLSRSSDRQHSQYSDMVNTLDPHMSTRVPYSKVLY
jgi:hypothetical protein